VDIIGNSALGGNTLLYLIDGLYAGYYWDGHPYKWALPPFGDGHGGTDWPSSLFASLDPVAIDSVAYDFLLAEWPRVVTGGEGPMGSLLGGEEDYLHEAALADIPPSGTFYDPDGTGAGLPSLGVHEHWNNPSDKQYTRNLGTGDGIELIAVGAGPPEPGPDGDVDADGDVDLADLAALLGAYGRCVGDPFYNPNADFDESGCVDLGDLAALLGNYGYTP
jgi:hypothetical protein